MHPRAVIRAKVRELLEADPTIAGGGWQVRDDQVEPADVASAPGRRLLYVFVLGDEGGEIHLEAPRIYQRTADVLVELYTDLGLGETGVLAKLDDLCATVETALLATPTEPTLGGVAGDFRYGGTEIGLSADGETPTVGAVIRFVAEFYTTQSGALVDATGADIDYHLGAVEQPPDAESDADFPQ